MKMKKLLGIAIVGLIAIFGAGSNVKAANSNNVSLSCTKTTINIGESTVCTVSGTAYFDGTTTTAPSAVEIDIQPSDYLTITNVTGNTTAGFTKNSEQSSTESGIKTIKYILSNAGAASTITSGTKFDIMSFTVTLSQEAKNLSSTDDCGSICISAATFNTLGLTSGNFGTCYIPSVTITDCTGDSCNANTGAFLNYALIGVGCCVAIAAIIVARRNNKFYKI